jgi:microcystin-dependent protein
MSQPYLGEIRMVGFNYPPKGWALCNGQLLSIQQNQALFSLLGTTYGGNGTTNFQLPNLQGRVPIHQGNGFTIGQVGGEVAHTLTATEYYSHTHSVQASSTAGNVATASGNLLGTVAAPDLTYAAPGNPVQLQAGTIGAGGGSQPHNNMQPYLALIFCIALAGIFPSRN